MQKRTSRLLAAGTTVALLAGMNTAMALPLVPAQPAAGSAHASVVPVRYRHHHGHWGHGGWGGGWGGWGWGGPALGLGLLGLGLATAAAHNNYYASEGGPGPSDCIRHHGQLYCR